MDIQTSLVIHIYEHILSFHLLVSSISFISVLWFSMYRSLISLVKFICSYFIVFYEIVNEIVLLLFISDSVFSVQKHHSFLYIDSISCDFAECISCESGSLERSGFSIYSIQSLHIVTVLLLPFQFGFLSSLFLA